jgi:hypothetical protein
MLGKRGGQQIAEIAGIARDRRDPTKAYSFQLSACLSDHGDVVRFRRFRRSLSYPRFTYFSGNGWSLSSPSQKMLRIHHRVPSLKS